MLGHKEFSLFGKEKDDDHDQDFLSKDVLHIWSESSENLLLRRRRTMTMTKIPSRSAWYTFGHGPLLILLHYCFLGGQKMNINFSGTPRISDIPPKSLVSLGFEGHTELFGPTRSRGRPPPHRDISGPKSLGPCSFFLPDFPALEKKNSS